LPDGALLQLECKGMGEPIAVPGREGNCFARASDVHCQDSEQMIKPEQNYSTEVRQKHHRREIDVW